MTIGRQVPRGRAERPVHARARRAAAGALLLFLPACAHAVQQEPGAPDPSNARRQTARSVVLCSTTEAELRDRLGEPTRDGIFRRDRLLTWIISEDDVVRYLGVLVDARGVVVDLVWNVPTEVPWAPSNQCANR